MYISKNDNCFQGTSIEKFVSGIEDKEKYVIHVRALKQALNNGLILKEYME